MATLYELNEKIMNFKWECDEETGEILNADALDELELEFKEKIRNIGLYIKNLESDADQYEKAEKEFAQKKKSAKNKVDSLKQYLSSNLNGATFKSDDGLLNISYRKSESLEIAEGTEVPLKYLVAQEPKVDKVALKKAIKEGKTFNGITIIEKQNIQVK